MKKFLLRFTVYVVSLLLIVGGLGYYGLMRTQKDFYLNVRHEPVPSFPAVEAPPYDPTKPTVAVVLADTTLPTEDFDFLIPYSLFSMTDAYNVYAVAPDHKVKSLSGGLDVIPHYTYQELDQVVGKSPDIIVVPFMPIIDEAKYLPTRKWIQQHANSQTTTFLSICGGSGNLADAGLLQGKSATSHWQAIPDLRKLYTDTHWKEDVRYVHEGNTLTSAGQSAGFDAVLHLISQKLGEPVAAKIAKEISYPSYHFVANPKVDPFYVDVKFATYILNSAFHWNKTQMGVMLYQDMDELALSSIFDSYADTGTAQILTISNSEEPVITKHHLTVVARHSIASAPRLDKMIVPGGDAKTLAAEDLKLWSEKGHAGDTLLIHSDAPNRYVFEAPLEDLAKQDDLLTAAHGVKRFEYRSDNIHLEGSPFPIATYGYMLLACFVAWMVAFMIDRRFILKKAVFKSAKQPTL
ncbi:UNVERIFIED_CONTAM: AraC family transcriptional activator FtrA [Brevibacillus sp. OAP136]